MQSGGTSNMMTKKQLSIATMEQQHYQNNKATIK
jgi:hypothetical protein